MPTWAWHPTALFLFLAWITTLTDQKGGGGGGGGHIGGGGGHIGGGGGHVGGGGGHMGGIGGGTHGGALGGGNHGGNSFGGGNRWGNSFGGTNRGGNSFSGGNRGGKENHGNHGGTNIGNKGGQIHNGNNGNNGHNGGSINRGQGNKGSNGGAHTSHEGGTHPNNRGGQINNGNRNNQIHPNGNNRGNNGGSRGGSNNGGRKGGSHSGQRGGGGGGFRRGGTSRNRGWSSGNRNWYTRSYTRGNIQRGGNYRYYSNGQRNRQFDEIRSANGDQDWLQFRNSFGNQGFRFGNENQQRQQFFNNRDQVIQHNELFGLGQIPFLTRLNDFSDFSLGDFQSLLMGLINPPSNINRIDEVPKVDEHKHPYRPKSMSPDVQPSIDYRDHGYVTPVRQQGRCGCCWTFSAAGAMEGQLYAATGHLVDLSEQNLIDCAKDSYGNHGCNGGWPANAFRYVKENGIMAEDDYPFTGSDSQACHFNSESRIPSLVVTGSAYLPEGDEDKLKEAVYNLGPIASTVNADAWGFQHYSSGIYTDDSCSKKVNHAVLITGYGEENGKDYWLIKNSWGTNWGDDGYMKFARNNNNQCGIASYAQYPILSAVAAPETVSNDDRAGFDGNVQSSFEDGSSFENGATDESGPASGQQGSESAGSGEAQTNAGSQETGPGSGQQTGSHENASGSGQTNSNEPNDQGEPNPADASHQNSGEQLPADPNAEGSHETNPETVASFEINPGGTQANPDT